MTETSRTPIGRRRMIQLTAAGVLAGAATQALAAPARKRVIVIGGGIGGLSCAYDLMERGHDVTVLEAARRTGGHVKTIYDPLPDGLYADVGAEHFYEPGYVAYRHWVRKFDLPAIPYERRRNLYRRMDGRWRTEAELSDARLQREMGCNEREVAHMQEYGWSELPRLYMSMGSRIVLQAKTRFWEGDSLPSINLVTADNKLGYIWECATEVPGDSCVLLGGGRALQTPEETLAAFRAVYPGKHPDTIERCIVHQWWKEEPTAVRCERGAFPLGQLARMWPHLIAPVGRIHFVGAAYDALPHGQDAATLSARRAAAAIDGA